MAMFLGRTKTRTTHEFFPEGPHAISNLLIKTTDLNKKRHIALDLLPRPQRPICAAVGNLFITHYKHASFQNARFLFVARSSMCTMKDPYSNNRSFHVYQHVTSFSHMRGALVGRRTTAAGFHMQNMCDV